MNNRGQIPGETIIICNQNGNIMHWSSVAEDVLGWKKHEVLGKPIKEIIPEIYCDNFSIKKLKTDFQSVKREGLIIKLPFSSRAYADITLTRVNVIEEDFYIVTSVDRIFQKPQKRAQTY